MTQRFPWSRLEEIVEAPPVEPVSFPGREEVALLKRSLQRIRHALGLRGGPPEPATRRQRLLR